jgi:hypothetical protein
MNSNGPLDLKQSKTATILVVLEYTTIMVGYANIWFETLLGKHWQLTTLAESAAGEPVRHDQAPSGFLLHLSSADGLFLAAWG